MTFGRVLPPAAARLGWRDLAHGAAGLVSPRRPLKALEEELQRHFGVRHVFLVSSGTAALTATLQALQSRSQRSEVVIPAYTCFSVPAAVLESGLHPVLCDVDPSTFGIDVNLLEKHLNERTLCVVVHHLFGIPSDVAGVYALCRARGITVIEDAAQAMGGISDGRCLGTIGDVGMFSAGRGKAVTSGAGGIIVTNSNSLAAAISHRVGLLKDRGLLGSVTDLARAAMLALFVHPRVYWIPAALPWLRLGQTIFPANIPMYRMSSVQAGLLRGWRARLAESSAIRAATGADLWRRLVDVEPRSTIPYLRLPVLVRDRSERDRVLEVSQRLGLGLSAAYPVSLDQLPELRATCAGAHVPVAQQMAARILTLPTHHLVSERDRAAIAACFAIPQQTLHPAV